MALYMIGDIQGCDQPLGRLLNTINFSPSRDTLYLLGDLVNRGPDSLGVVRRLMSLGTSAQCLLGNHDLHLLAVAHGVRKPHRSDTLGDILSAPDRTDLLDWVRSRSLAIEAHGWLMVHAGVLPAWDKVQTLALAHEVETVLRGSDWGGFLNHMYGNQPPAWCDSLQGFERLRVIVNALTRLRFCSADGVMEFDTKDSAAAAPEGFVPWFDVPGRKTQDTPIAFGHWSTLKSTTNGGNTLALDTGCVWGGCLTAARWLEGGRTELIQVRCPQARKPGKT